MWMNSSLWCSDLMAWKTLGSTSVTYQIKPKVYIFTARFKCEPTPFGLTLFVYPAKIFLEHTLTVLIRIINTNQLHNALYYRILLQDFNKPLIRFWQNFVWYVKFIYYTLNILIHMFLSINSTKNKY